MLTFPKSAYRLGETILGVVELNERHHRARVLKVNYSPGTASDTLTYTLPPSIPAIRDVGGT